jgi:hypothetical protein
MAKTVFDVLNEKINEHKHQIKEFIADTRCKDYAHYKELCGLIRGLETAQKEVQDLSRNFMEDEDD